MASFLSQSYIFMLTFITYAAMYTTRISQSYCKSSFQKDMNLSNDFLGTLDMCFILSISLTFAFTGRVAKLMKIKYFLSIGYIPSALIFLSIPLMKKYQIHNQTLLITLYCINGIFQAPIWPALVAVMGNWFKNGRGVLFGIWSANANFGNILGLQICYIIMQVYGFQWDTCYFVNGLFMLTMGVYNLLFLRDAPDQQEITLTESQLQNKEQKKQTQSNDSIIQKNEKQETTETKGKQIQLNFINAWLVPGVTIYTLSYTFMKSTNFGLMFWLPKYLNEVNLAEQSATITQFLQIGSFVGGLFIGYLNDKFGKSGLIMLPIVTSTAFFMVLFKSYTGPQIWIYCVLIFAIGVCLIGPYNILGSSISIQLSEQPMIKGDPNSIIFISSLIEGVAGIFSAITQQIIPLIGKNNLFYLFIVYCILSGLFLLPIFINDVKSIFSKEKKE